MRLSWTTPRLHAHLLALLDRCGTIEDLKQIHSLLIVSSHSNANRAAASSAAKVLLFAAFTDPGELDYASLLCRRTESPLPFLWNAVLRCRSLQSRNHEAIAHYVQMLRHGANPDENTYPLLLKVAARSGLLDANQVHSQVCKLGFGDEPFVWNSLVAAYAKCGDLAVAHKLFDLIPNRDPVAWTAMIHGCMENGRALDGLALFVKMKLFGVHVDAVVITGALKGCGMVEHVCLGRSIHGFFVECGRVNWDVFVGSALVDMYAKCGYCDDAQRVFEEIPYRNVVTWTALISGYVHCSRYKDALSFFRRMQIEDIRPNQVTLASALTACAQMGALDQGRWIHQYVKRNNLNFSSVLNTALVDMYAKCGCIDEAVAIFDRMPHKDVYPWTALINAFAVHGYAFECLDLFSKMVKEKVQPNEITFIGVLSACTHGGLVDEGWRLFNSMSEDYGIEHNMEHYGCMVDLLGRAGRLLEALNLIKRIPMEEVSAGVWGALLSACVKRKDVELGVRIGTHLVETQPHSSSGYTFLANLFSVSRKWDDAASVRRAMKGVQVEKIKGCSWVEIGGAVHEFVAFNESHPRSKDIYRVLNGIHVNMRTNWYVHDSHPTIL